MKKKVVALIPAYNEERTIAKVILRAKRYADIVIVCDDGSSDMTGDIAEALGAKVIRHPRNLGYGAAISTLFKAALTTNGDIAVTLDADLQHDPDDIPRLIKPILNGEADIVIGSRFLGHGKMPGYREKGVKAITEFVKGVGGLRITDAQSGYRAYTINALRQITISEMGMGVSTEILLKAKEKDLRITEIPINIRYNVEKPSTHNPIYHGIDVILSIIKHLSIRHPLIFYGAPGMASLIIALTFWVWTFTIFAETRKVITNIALVAIGTTIIGLMLLTTAILLWVILSVIKEKL